MAVEALKQIPERGISRGIKILLVAGEASSDEHSAGLVTSLLELEPNASIFGMGGSQLRAAGMETLVDSEHSASVMGLTEVLGSAFRILDARKTLLQSVDQRSPDLAILVDYPDFNLSLAKQLSARKVPVMYFISPQLWAWREGRVKQIKRYVKRMVSIFPFEPEFYQRHGIRADYVGHPFADRGSLQINRDNFLLECGLDPKNKTIALLPGSRKFEIERMLPVMLEALLELRKTVDKVQALIPVAPTLSKEFVAGFVKNLPGVSLIEGQAREVLSVSDAAVITSGTATVEGALSGTPFVVAYRFSRLTYLMARLLVRGVKYFAMANLIAGRKVVPELLQSEANKSQIAEELRQMLLDDVRRAEIIRGLSEIQTRLQPPNQGERAVEQAARIALQIIEIEREENSGQ